MIVAKDSFYTCERINTATGSCYFGDSDIDDNGEHISASINFVNADGVRNNSMEFCGNGCYERMIVTLEWLDSIHNVKFAPKNANEDAE